MVYTVRSEFDDPSTRQPYLEWLTGGHASAVVTEGGALRAEVATLDDSSVETRYLFASREAFAAYEAGPAVALRTDGTTKFPAGVRTTRSIGDLAGVYES